MTILTHLYDSPVAVLALVSTLSWLLGWCGDYCWGDPSRWHPIILFGKLIAWGEYRYNHGAHRLLSGAIVHTSLILATLALYSIPSILGLWAWQHSPSAEWSILILLLWTTIEAICIDLFLSGTTLIKEVQAVFDTTKINIEMGRRQVSRIVGRDTSQLSEQEIHTAALETLSENLNDGVIAPMFWWALLGLPGMAAYKMINTQDSMVGYRTERYNLYGRWAAHIDDLVGYLPARLTALLMLLSARRIDLLPFVRRFGRAHSSPNSGYPESALAGILDCQFGGAHNYFGKVVEKPLIGDNPRLITQQDASIAIAINRKSEVTMLLLSLGFRLLLFVLYLSLL